MPRPDHLFARLSAAFEHPPSQRRSRNDAVGNAAVLLAVAGVFGSGTGWPDIIVAPIMAMLAISGGWQICRQALGELRHTRRIPLAAE